MSGREAIIRYLENGKCAVWFCVRAAQSHISLCAHHDAEARLAGQAAAYFAERSLDGESE
jgi:hypothetical protein